jgi:hypothetical protein
MSMAWGSEEQRLAPTRFFEAKGMAAGEQSFILCVSSFTKH